MDKRKNNFCKFLINLCTGQNSFIMNGGVGSDSNIGELTCRNSSTVDYLICTPNFIKCIDDLTIPDFSKYFPMFTRHSVLLLKTMLMKIVIVLYML